MKPLDPPCIDWKPALVGFLDNELPAAERAALEAHVASCSGCRSDLAELEATSAFLRRQEPVEPRRELWEPLPEHEAPARRYALASRQRASFTFGGRIREALIPAGIGAALAAAAVACLFLLRPPSAEVRALAADVAALRAELARAESALAAAAQLAAAPGAVTTGANSTSTSAGTPATTAPARAADDMLLAEISRRIAESEARQDSKFLFTTDQLARSLSLQRRDDLAEIERDLRDVRAETFQALVTTHERLDRLARPAVLGPALEPDLPVSREESRSQNAGGGGKPKDERLEPRW